MLDTHLLNKTPDNLLDDLSKKTMCTPTTFILVRIGLDVSARSAFQRCLFVHISLS